MGEGEEGSVSPLPWLIVLSVVLFSWNVGSEERVLYKRGEGVNVSWVYGVMVICGFATEEFRFGGKRFSFFQNSFLIIPRSTCLDKIQRKM